MLNLITEANDRLLEATDMSFIRSMIDDINWKNRLIAIVGARGAGKTTLMLQQIKRSKNSNKMLYVTAEHIYFSIKSLTEFADEFSKNGGETLFIDEIHQYDNWAKEIKVIHDTFPKLKLVISGSSILDLHAGSTDLSRRLMSYELHGLSFREYLLLKHKIEVPLLKIEEIHQQKKVKLETPLKYFKEYLKEGYYPFFKDENYPDKLQNIINKIIDIDLVKHISLNAQTGTKLKRLLGYIAENVPFKPNISKLSNIINVSTRLLPEYLDYMEKGGLIHTIHQEGKSVTVLAKPDKIFLNNTNMAFVLREHPDIGNLRETFFLSSLKGAKKEVDLPKKGDFVTNDGFVYEIGGKNKNKKQILDVPNAFVVNDDIEVGFGNNLPLWKFGLIY